MTGDSHRPPRSGCAINDAIEVLGALWSMLVLRDGIFGNRRHFCELLEAWAAHALQLVVGIRVRGHNDDRSPALCGGAAPDWRLVPVPCCPRQTQCRVRQPPSDCRLRTHPRAGVNGCGGRKARW